MSKSTLVSTLPFKLTESKPGLNPAYYEVPAAEFGDISILVIEDGFHIFLVPGTDDRTPPMRVTDTSSQIAKSLIDDYISANLEVDLETEAIPGMFYLDGPLTADIVKKAHKDKIEEAKLRTHKWFQRLITLADDDWAKYHQHKAITELQRSACNYLGLKREWNFNVVEMLANLCWACKSPVHPEALICNQCKAIINSFEYEKRKNDFVLEKV